MKVAYLGPAGTFSEDALRAAAGAVEIDALPSATVHDAIRAVAEGEAALALVPFENSIEGSVRSTLDALAFDGEAVTIAGEHDHPIRHSLIARSALEPERIEVVLSHPQILAQCARFLRQEIPGADVRAVGVERRGDPDRQSRGGAVGGAGRELGGGNLRLHGPARGGRGRAGQRHPLRLDRPRGRARRRRGHTPDDAGLLRAGARITPARWSMR